MVLKKDVRVLNIGHPIANYFTFSANLLQFRKKAIKYCSLILKRQIEFNIYELIS